MSRLLLDENGLDRRPHKVYIRVPQNPITEAWGYEEPKGLDIYVEVDGWRYALRVPLSWIRAYMRRIEKGKK